MATAKDKQEVEELITQLKNLCYKKKYPFFVSVCIPSDSGDRGDIRKGEYINDFISPFNCNVKVKPDYIAEGIKAICGFGEMRSRDAEMEELNYSLPSSFRNFSGNCDGEIISDEADTDDTADDIIDGE